MHWQLFSFIGAKQESDSNKTIQRINFGAHQTMLTPDGSSRNACEKLTQYDA